MKGRSIQSLTIHTRARSQMVEITRLVEKTCGDVSSGFIIACVPHTTAGITIQENADPDVQHDLLKKLDALVPKQETYYRHGEGNSDSHLKTAIVGNSVTVLVEAGRLVLGRWQGIYLCEFDGPRQRQVALKVVET